MRADLPSTTPPPPPPPPPTRFYNSVSKLILIDIPNHTKRRTSTKCVPIGSNVVSETQRNIETDRGLRNSQFLLSPSSFSVIVSAMAVDSTEECHSVHAFVVLPDEPTSLQYERPLSIHSVEVPNLLRSEMCLNCTPNLQNSMNLKVDRDKTYVPCIFDIDIEHGKAEVPSSNEDCLSNSKSEDFIAGALRYFGLQIGGKIMQLMMNHGTELPKFTSRDRIHDTSTNRSKKYKRSSSFNSRRVVLLFSALSIMGTVILICLTLRVRQISNGSDNI